MADRWGTSDGVVKLLAGRWILKILAEIVDGGRRYQYLHDALDDALDGVSYKVLTETLRRAERDGLIARHLDPGASRLQLSTN